MATRIHARVIGKGFTLIELLVVISIISLLLAILLPSLAQARKASQSTVCMSNLRQVGVAVTLYTNDFKGWLPCATRSGGTPAWWKIETAPYTRNMIVDWDTMQADSKFGKQGMYGCPGFAGVSPACQSKLDYYPGQFGGLGWSNSISYRGDTQRARLLDFKTFAESALVGDTIDIAQYNATSSSLAYQYQYLYFMSGTDVDARISRRHRQGLNLLWADMHVTEQKQSYMAAGKNNNIGWYYYIH